jgi:Amt family ammonium transporter
MRGSMDFAGGTAVHVCSGATVAAYCIFFQLEVRGWRVRNLWGSSWQKKRDNRICAMEQVDQRRPNGSQLDGPSNIVESEGPSKDVPSPTTNPEAVADGPAPGVEDPNLELEMQHLEASENHSVTNIVLGTTLLWFGWFGFNGGSAQGANLRAVSAVLATHIAACAGGSVGLLLEWIFVLPSRILRKDTSGVTPSVLGFCDGAISGLVAITPAAGFVSVLKL